MKPPHRRVSEHAAKNPVARALAWKKLRAFTTEARVSVYLRDEGSEQREFVVNIAEYLALAQYGAAFDKIQDHDYEGTPLKVIDEAMRLLRVCSEEHFCWKKDYAATLDQALLYAQELCEVLTPLAVNRAWLAVHDPNTLTRLQAQQQGMKKR